MLPGAASFAGVHRNIPGTTAAHLLLQHTEYELEDFGTHEFKAAVIGVCLGRLLVLFLKIL